MTSSEEDSSSEGDDMTSLDSRLDSDTLDEARGKKGRMGRAYSKRRTGRSGPIALVARAGQVGPALSSRAPHGAVRTHRRLGPLASKIAPTANSPALLLDARAPTAVLRPVQSEALQAHSVDADSDEPTAQTGAAQEAEPDSVMKVAAASDAEGLIATSDDATITVPASCSHNDTATAGAASLPQSAAAATAEDRSRAAVALVHSVADPLPTAAGSGNRAEGSSDTAVSSPGTSLAVPELVIAARGTAVIAIIDMLTPAAAAKATTSASAAFAVADRSLPAPKMSSQLDIAVRGTDAQTPGDQLVDNDGENEEEDISQAHQQVGSQQLDLPSNDPKGLDAQVVSSTGKEERVEDEEAGEGLDDDSDEQWVEHMDHDKQGGIEEEGEVGEGVGMEDEGVNTSLGYTTFLTDSLLNRMEEEARGRGDQAKPLSKLMSRFCTTSQTSFVKQMADNGRLL